jgi:hypothetical protein
MVEQFAPLESHLGLKAASNIDHDTIPGATRGVTYSSLTMNIRLDKSH